MTSETEHFINLLRGRIINYEVTIKYLGHAKFQNSNSGDIWLFEAIVRELEDILKEVQSWDHQEKRA